jgi:hypothetical protein
MIASVYPPPFAKWVVSSVVCCWVSLSTLNCPPTVWQDFLFLCCRVSLSALTGPPSCSAGFTLFCSAGFPWALWPTLPPVLLRLLYSVLQGFHKRSDRPSLLFCRVYFILFCRVSLSALTGPPSCSAGFPFFCAAGCSLSALTGFFLFCRVLFILCCRAPLASDQPLPVLQGLLYSVL